jgi:hypothetical protein
VSDKKCSIALVVPGLCGPAFDAPLAEYLTAETPALDRLLTRALKTAAPSTLDGTFATFFEPLAGSDNALPVASLTWLADTGESCGDYLLRIDPVHVRADQSCLRLFDAATFSLEPDEARALVEAFNDFYSERGWQLQAPHPQRWYLALPQAPDMTTIAPGHIGGEDINDFLPAGAGSRAWHALMNEVQMLFHDHPVNAARVQRGELPVNSIWPWGGGVLPSKPDTFVTQVITDQPLLIGLAQLAGVFRRDLPGEIRELPALLQDGLNLVVVDHLEKAARYADAEAWSEGIDQLEQTWCVPLLELLESRKLGSLELYPVNGQRYSSNRRRLRYFWRRLRPFTTLCNND